jgi:hypothetical protein
LTPSAHDDAGIAISPATIAGPLLKTTAKALGVKISDNLLSLADEVIE